MEANVVNWMYCLELIKFDVSNKLLIRSRKWSTAVRRRAVMENDPWEVMESHGKYLGKKCGKPMFKLQNNDSCMQILMIITRWHH